MVFKNSKELSSVILGIFFLMGANFGICEVKDFAPAKTPETKSSDEELIATVIQILQQDAENNDDDSE